MHSAKIQGGGANSKYKSKGEQPHVKCRKDHFVRGANHWTPLKYMHEYILYERSKNIFYKSQGETTPSALIRYQAHLSQPSRKARPHRPVPSLQNSRTRKVYYMVSYLCIIICVHLCGNSSQTSCILSILIDVINSGGSLCMYTMHSKGRVLIFNVHLSIGIDVAGTIPRVLIKGGVLAHFRGVLIKIKV